MKKAPIPPKKLKYNLKKQKIHHPPDHLCLIMTVEIIVSLTNSISFLTTNYMCGCCEALHQNKIKKFVQMEQQQYTDNLI